MTFRLLPVLLVLSGALFVTPGAQESAVSNTDSSNHSAAAAAPAQSTASPGDIVLKPKIATYDFDAMPKDPLASAFFSATLPGTGQLYNKEYLRGIITGIAFYGSVIGIQYLVNKWEEMNTDTFYITEAYADIVHPVYTPKPDSLQVGLPTGDKVALVAAIVVCAASYVFGIYDSYTGAQRYNRKLMESHQIKFGFSADPLEKKVAVCAKYQF
jgi:TM2 domain-containing membrane protein YozV